MVRARNCFYMAPRRIGRKHPYFVLTDPDENGEVLVVNATTPHDYTKDFTVLLTPEDVPSLEHDSVVAYEHARQLPASQLYETASRNDTFVDDITPEILGRIRQGLLDSKHALMPMKTYLLLQTKEG